MFNINTTDEPIGTANRPSAYRVDYSLPQTGADTNLLMWSHGTIRGRNSAAYNYPTKNAASLGPYEGLTTYVSIGATYGITTREGWDEWLTQNQPLQLCYELATPNTYSITPQTINTLRGANNFTTNTNGNIELTYWTH